MTIPQLTGTKRSILLILLMVPIGGVANASLAGEIHSLFDIGETLRHGIVPAICMAFGWVFFRSPWGAEVQNLLHQETSTTQILPSGATVSQKTETTIIAPKSDMEAK